VPAKSKRSASKPVTSKAAQKAPTRRAKGSQSKTADDAQSSPGEFRPGSKQAKIVELMKRAKGIKSERAAKAA
jgi:hypothetical protein